MLIDVRTPIEFKLEHPDNAINIPIDELESAKLEVKPNEEIVLCCMSGMRARIAQSILKDLGYKRVSLYNGTGSCRK